MSSSAFRTIEAQHELHVSVHQEQRSARDVEDREEGEDCDDDPSQRSEVGVIHCIHHLVEIDEGIHDMLAGWMFRVVDLGVRATMRGGWEVRSD